MQTFLGNSPDCYSYLHTFWASSYFFGHRDPGELVKGPVPTLHPDWPSKSGSPGFQVLNGLPRDSDADFLTLLLRNASLLFLA